MRALRFNQFGSPSVLSLVDLPAPSPAAGEVLVEVRAASINPSDVKNVAGAFPHTALPRTPGRDGAGVVISGARELIGREVWFVGDGDLGYARDGSHATHVLLPRQAVRPKPRNLSFEQAAAVGVVAVTAAYSLDALALQGGQTLLIIGVGSVGGRAAQIAKWRGCRVLGTAQSAALLAKVRAEKVDVVINLERDDLVETVKASTGNRGVDAVLNTVGGKTFEPALQCLAPGGRCAIIASPGKERVEFNLKDFYRQELHLVGLNTIELDAARTGELLDELAPGFESGALESPPIEILPLEQAKEGYEKTEKGGGKIVLKMT